MMPPRWSYIPYERARRMLLSDRPDRGAFEHEWWRGLRAYDEGRYNEALSHLLRAFEDPGALPEDALQPLLHDMANCSLILGNLDVLFAQPVLAAGHRLITNADLLLAMQQGSTNDKLFFLSRLAMYYCHWESDQRSRPVMPRTTEAGALVDPEAVSRLLHQYLTAKPDDTELQFHYVALLRARNEPEAVRELPAGSVSADAATSEEAPWYLDRMTGLRLRRLTPAGWDFLGPRAPRPSPSLARLRRGLAGALRRASSFAQQGVERVSSIGIGPAVRSVAGVILVGVCAASLRWPLGDSYLVGNAPYQAALNWPAGVVYLLLGLLLGMVVFDTVRSYADAVRVEPLQLIGLLALSLLAAAGGLLGFAARGARPMDWLLLPLALLSIRPAMAWASMGLAISALTALLVRYAKRTSPVARGAIALGCATMLLGVPRLGLSLLPRGHVEALVAYTQELARQGSLRAAATRGLEVIDAAPRPSLYVEIATWSLALARQGLESGDSAWVHDAERVSWLAEKLRATHPGAREADEISQMMEAFADRVLAEGDQLSAQGRTREAIQIGENLLQLRSTSVYEYTVSEWYLILAMDIEKQGADAGPQKERALALARLAEQHAPHDAKAVAQLALAAACTDNDSLARTMAKKALSLDPDNRLAKEVLGRLGEM